MHKGAEEAVQVPVPVAIQLPEPTPKGAFGEVHPLRFAAKFVGGVAGDEEECDCKPMRKVVTHTVDGETCRHGVLGFTAHTFVEVAGLNVATGPVTAASADETLRPDDATETLAALFVGTVALDEALVEAGEVVYCALERGHD